MLELVGVVKVDNIKATLFGVLCTNVDEFIGSFFVAWGSLVLITNETRRR